MDFFDNVVNKSNAIIKERLNNPFGQKQGQQQQQSQEQPFEQQNAAANQGEAVQVQQANTSSADNINNETDPETSTTTDSQDKNSQFAAIAADAEAVAQKAAKGAQKFGTFLFSMANKAGQTVTQTAKQVKQAVENTSILTDFTREQQEFIRDHGGSMQAGELPWICASDGDEQKATYLKEQILSLSQDKRNFVRNPPPSAEYKFEPQKCYPIALSLLREDPNLNKMRYELVPKLVNEDTFWCNYFYRVEMLKQEGEGRRAGWASSRSSSGEGPDEITTGGGAQAMTVSSQSFADETTDSANYTVITQRQDPQAENSSNLTNIGTSKESNNDNSSSQALLCQTGSSNLGEQYTESSSDTQRAVSDADDLKRRLRELNIDSFDGGRDAAKYDEDDDEWDEELQREFELVSGDLSGLDEDDLKSDLLELERTKKMAGKEEQKVSERQE